MTRELAFPSPRAKGGPVGAGRGVAEPEREDMSGEPIRSAA
jgi:hypothetical protein